uniref:Uncharacterized protein n=1 Tax=Opuntia streptacantha TaxID=393608 RepID=A0A7C8ZPN2_OPUST
MSVQSLSDFCLTSCTCLAYSLIPFANSSQSSSKSSVDFLSFSSSLTVVDRETLISNSSRASFRCKLSDRFLNFLSFSNSSLTDWRAASIRSCSLLILTKFPSDICFINSSTS